MKHAVMARATDNTCVMMETPRMEMAVPTSVLWRKTIHALGDIHTKKIIALTFQQK